MKKTVKKDSIRLSEYIEKKLKMGSIVFLKTDAINDMKTTELAFMKSSQRLIKKGVLLRPVSGFYVVIEFEFRDAGGPPPIYYIDKMMKYLKLPYYVGLLTAAKFHGATHQPVFETQVFTVKPIPKMTYGKNRIRFITNKFAEKIPKQSLQTPHGDVLISTPEATLVDLVRYQKKAVGFSHVATVIREFNGKINTQFFGKLAEIHNDTPLFQRVGYLLEIFGKKNADSIQRWLKKRSYHVVKLDPSKERGSKINKKWAININLKVEADDL
jgi:predicted transcriptional regulator of viral defense system